MADEPRDTGNWAKPASTLTVTAAPADAPNLVEGKRLLSPVQGFGGVLAEGPWSGSLLSTTTPQAIIFEMAERFLLSGPRATTSTHR